MIKDKIINDFFQVDLSEIALPNYAVYFSPKDYMGQYVVRLWDADGLKATNCIVIGKTIQQVRAAIPPGLTRFPRAVGDDPQIVETWI
ncbi:hypothetical protein [Desulfitobacterium sp.]|uniref:hypothetical protein n=1 Tax=Desulfitobacterium sp. TaxID=49981 RepID=UPI002BCAA675|nr:hypothetical protein [Desulfitobacterium sp.]HVJ49228.1 hypothetical protein [Desulfitobacterium sp.]